MRLCCLVLSLIFSITVAACVTGCGTSSTPAAPLTEGGADDATTPEAGAPADVTSEPDPYAHGPIGGARPVSVHVPPTYVAGTAMPLVIMLHGAGVSGDIEDYYLHITAQSDARGFLYAHPDGTLDAMGNSFWNATDACCNFSPPLIDDSTYLSTLIKQIQAHYTVDPKRIFFVGHSNGGFMSHRMACDHADQIAAIVSFAGAMPLDASLCKPSVPVSVLEIHGTADTTIAFDGGANEGHAYPSAETTVNDWVTLDGCTNSPDTSSPPLDLDGDVVGSETTVTKYGVGCKPGGHAELWTVQGGGHVPSLNPIFPVSIVDFLFAHPKP